MLFNSIDFAIFFPVFFLLYWFVFNKNVTQQNVLTLLASMLFYGWWDWWFLLLLLVSSGIDFLSGYLMGKTTDKRRRKLLLMMSLVTNLGILGFFKYFNFFVDNFVSAFRLFGAELQPTTLHIILPVGVSFYTFLALSYTIDVYRGKMNSINDPLLYFTYISFFPQLVAGPIERAVHMAPQFMQLRRFEYSKAVDGTRQILWGLFKKIVVADNCAPFVNQVFDHHEQYQGWSVGLGVVLFAFQIYCDFSGYSDIAIGSARLLGVDVMRNFNYPYFSRDVAEFWRRWHISLTSWFRDYVYIPLGGSRAGRWMSLRNTMIVFLISGFWHGANWTFIVWGALNAIFYLPLLLANNHRTNLETVAMGRFLPNGKEILQMIITFLLICFSWVFFRAVNFNQAMGMLGHFTPAKIGMGDAMNLPGVPLAGIVLLLLFEWVHREKQHGFQFGNGLLARNTFLRWGLYLSIVFIILWFRGAQQKFIYFDF
jgi:D-alanyl-lipoteichoic acid acyltransferase DltB (MBOAT superfamily)